MSSLLAFMAEKFELERPPDDCDGGGDDDGGAGSDDDFAGGIGGCATPFDGDEAEGGPPHAPPPDFFSLLRDEDARAAGRRLADGAASPSKDDDGECDKDDFECIGSVRDSPGGGSPSSPGASRDDASARSRSQQETKLLVTFLLMVVVGTFNKVFQKLQAIPMYNYPNSLNLLQNFVYVPLCFAYILPVSRFGLLNNAISHEVSVMSKSPFVVMGLLDCLTCTLLTFAAVYLPGPLLVLLPQAAIPISMALSRKIKGERYGVHQYLGAVVVVLGILVVLEPLVTGRHVPDFTCEAYDGDEFCALCEEETTERGCLSHRTKESDHRGGWSMVVQDHWEVDPAERVFLRSLAESNSSETTPGYQDGELCRWTPTDSVQQSGSATTTTLVWSVVAILACVPMALSSIYKETTLSGSRTDVDPIFLNGWVALFQLLFSIPLSVPAGMTSSPPVMPSELPRNILDGIKCYLGTGTIASGCHPDDGCPDAPLYVNLFLVFNVCFNVLIVYILKFGSANVLFMASTVMVPLGNLAFALPVVPGSAPLKGSDLLGLAVILSGLVAYRFGDAFRCCGVRHLRAIPPLPWRRGKVRRRRGLGLFADHGERFEWQAVLEDNAASDLVGPHGLTPSTPLEEPLLAPIT